MEEISSSETSINVRLHGTPSYKTAILKLFPENLKYHRNIALLCYKDELV
jgi:hypothetical protein